MDNSHLFSPEGHLMLPKYHKDFYNPVGIHSYKDIPGWMNDSEEIYPRMVEQAQDGDKFVEIGVLLGQSSAFMGELIKDSGKDISFDAIDVFWPIPYLIEFYQVANHPASFNRYIKDLEKYFGKHCSVDIQNIIKHGYIQLGVQDYINLVTIDEKYAHLIYKDESLQFVWIDGDHTGTTVYNDLIGFWDKIKPGGYIGGDDIVYPDVEACFNKFILEKGIRKSNYEFTKNGFLIHKDS